MTTKKKTRRAPDRSGHGETLVDSAVAATIELGHAAESFQDSLSHVQNARKKGRSVTKRVGRAASAAKKKAVDMAKRVVKRPQKKTRAKKAARSRAKR